VGIGERPHFSPQPLLFLSDKFRLKGFGGVGDIGLLGNRWLFEITNFSKAAINASLMCGAGVTERKPSEIEELEVVLRWKIYMTAVM
jgi:hypothetical protein